MNVLHVPRQSGKSILCTAINKDGTIWLMNQDTTLQSLIAILNTSGYDEPSAFAPNHQYRVILMNPTFLIREITDRGWITIISNDVLAHNRSTHDIVFTISQEFHDRWILSVL